MRETAETLFEFPLGKMGSVFFFSLFCGGMVLLYGVKKKANKNGIKSLIFFLGFFFALDFLLGIFDIAYRFCKLRNERV